MKVEVSRFATVEDARAAAKRTIDEAAEEARQRYLTPGAGQALEYEAVYAEALRYVAAKAGPYPMLQADVDAGTAEDLAEAAAVVITTRQEWEQAGAIIRSLRLAGKRQIDEAETQADVAQIRKQVIAQLADL